MPVIPEPCAPGGGGPITVEGCCSPSLATAPLCRADGTPILLVLRSACADCGGTAADPEVAGWIDPSTGTFTAGAPPADAGPCQAGDCASVSLLRLCDQTGDECVPFLRHLVHDCDGTVTGSVDTTLDGVTPYLLSGTAGDCSACSAGCVETICRQRCDDTDGDGQPDATYSELWCVRADGSAELLLTYADDPSVPYAPVNPVECTYGCPETETVTLCDASGPFLRRYTFLDGQASYVDVELDGQAPHLVSGTVGVCTTDGTGGGGTACAAQTTPAAVLGLCLADGTAIAVVVTRDCATGTVTQDGWIDLGTGVFTPGAPPAGVRACGGAGQEQADLVDCGDGSRALLVRVCDTGESPGPETCQSHVLERCRCDQVGDEVVDYVELVAVDGCTGQLTSLGTYLPDLTGPYTPVNPVECPVEGAPPTTGVQARRVELAPGGSWDLSSQPLVQSVTATAHGGTGTITTSDGPTTLHAGESVTWSVQRDADAALTGPLVIAADTGTITVAWTQGVTL